MEERNFIAPKVLSHKNIQFETTISSKTGGGGHSGGGGHGGGGWPWLPPWLGNWCFITTACVEAKGLPDDCYELQTLRAFRDNELMRTAEGKSLVERYYKIAPEIVWKVKQEENSQQIFINLYETLVIKCVGLIEDSKYEEAKKTYVNVVQELERKYLSLDPAFSL